MAIFEQKVAKKVLLDDTETLKCFIENYHNINGHTEYIIRVQRGPLRDRSWHVYKRYNEFVRLHACLQQSGACPPLPPKRLLGNMEREFISQRQLGLQQYLNAVLMNPILASSLAAKRFVDPDNYSAPFHEVALQQTSLALRGEQGWEVVGPLADMGWRLRKHYFLVRRGKDELFASWLDYGPDKHLDERDMLSACKSLAQLRHPYVQPMELLLAGDTGALAVRAPARGGSLRDALCSARPRLSFLKKYGNPRGHRTLPPERVALYGRQILEALRFLHDKGLPYGHLHTGNLALSPDEERVQLLDLENGLAGVPSFYRPYFVQHRRIHSLQAVDVYCLGHVLYEMSFGSPLHESTCDSLPPGCPPALRSLLTSILSPEAVRAGLPTLESLLEHPFFEGAGVTLSPDEPRHLKLAAGVKEQLRSAQALLEERLREEQKMVRSQKRLVKVQELMSSEEEKKKRKQKAKQEQRQKEQALELQKPQPGSERSESAGSGNTAPGSLGTVTPPSAPGANAASPPPPPPPMMSPPPPPMPALNGGPGPPDSASRDRVALLGSICNFNKASLKKTTGDVGRH